MKLTMPTKDHTLITLDAKTNQLVNDLPTTIYDFAKGSSLEEICYKYDIHQSVLEALLRLWWKIKSKQV